MRTGFKIVFGLIPACLLTLAGLAFANLISTTYQTVLLTAGLAGTCGLVWSLVGHSRKAAPVVLLMLFIGMAGVLVGGISGAISALEIDRYNGQLGSPAELTLRLMAVAWFILGPTVVGLVQARRAIQMLRGKA
jgi:hypothetical protein